MKEFTSLHLLKLNQSGVTSFINAAAEPCRRIRDTRRVPGAQVTAVSKAPLRDPAAWRLNDFTMILRNRETDYITVNTYEVCCNG